MNNIKRSCDFRNTGIDLFFTCVSHLAGNIENWHEKHPESWALQDNSSLKSVCVKSLTSG